MAPPAFRLTSPPVTILPTVMVVAALKRILPLPVLASAPSSMAMAPVLATTSMVPPPLVIRSAVTLLVWVTSVWARMLMLPPPLVTAL